MEPGAAAVLLLVVAPDAVIGLVERAGEVGAGIGQREAVAHPPFLLRPAQHRDAVALDRLDRHQVVHVEAVRHPEQETALVPGLAFRRQRRPGGVVARRLQWQRVRRLVREPARDPFGIAQFPGEDARAGLEIAGRATDQRVEFLAQPVAIELDGLGLLDLLDGAALHEQALRRIERRQPVVARLERPHLAGNAEEVAEEVLEMRREIDQQLAFALAVKRLGRGARRHQPIVQRRLGGGEMRDKGAVEPHEAVALIEIGKGQPVLQGEFGHRRLLRECGIGNHRQIAATALHSYWQLPNRWGRARPAETLLPDRELPNPSRVPTGPFDS